MKMLPFDAYRKNHEARYSTSIVKRKEVPMYQEYLDLRNRFGDNNTKYFKAVVMPALREAFKARIANYTDAYGQMRGFLSRLMGEQQQAFNQLYENIKSTGSLDDDLFKRIAADKDAKKLEWIRNSIIASKSISFAVQEAELNRRRFGSPEHQKARLSLNAEKWRQAYLNANVDWVPEVNQEINEAIENFMVAVYAEQKIMPQFRSTTEATAYVHSLDKDVSPHIMIQAFNTSVNGCDDIRISINSLNNDMGEKLQEIPITITNSVLDTAYNNEDLFRRVLIMSQNTPEVEALFKEMYTKVLST